MGWQWYNKAPLSFYTSSGVMLEMPIHSTLNVNHVVNDMNTYSKRDKLSVPLQWSTAVGVGIQYDITPHIGFYLEPSLQYFFNDGSDIKAIARSIALALPCLSASASIRMKGKDVF